MFNHRNGSEADPPPDNDTIQMKMAIVSWQPGPNRIIQLPTEVRLISSPTSPVHAAGLPCFSRASAQPSSGLRPNLQLPGPEQLVL